MIEKRVYPSGASRVTRTRQASPASEPTVLIFLSTWSRDGIDSRLDGLFSSHFVVGLSMSWDEGTNVSADAKI